MIITLDDYKIHLPYVEYYVKYKDISDIHQAASLIAVSYDCPIIVIYEYIKRFTSDYDREINEAVVKCMKFYNIDEVI